MQITTGPFAGTSFTQDQAYVVPGEREGEAPRAVILMPVLTQAFLSKFNPLEGWGVEVESKILDINMYPRAKQNEIVTEAVPCIQFDAKLINPQSRVVATASTVWTMKEPGAWETGETNCRKRLYEAMGLQTRFPVPEGMVVPSTLPPSVAGVVQLRDPSALTGIAPLVDEPAGKGDPGTAEDPAPVEVTNSKSVVESEPAQAAGAVQNEATPATAPAEAAQGNVIEMASATGGRRARRERLPDDAPCPPALRDQVVRLANLKGVPVPETATKGQANTWLKAQG